MSIAISSPTSSSFAPIPQPKRWTVKDFHQLRGMPWFESRRMILVQGEILEMPSPNPPHDAALGLTDQALRAAFGSGFWVRGQMALVLGQTTDPVPDLAVVPGSPRDYTEHPRTALLVVEIADSSLKYDTAEKASLYAAGAIAEYWVVDLTHRKLIVHRDPQADVMQPFGAAYRNVAVLDAAATVNAFAAPTAAVRVSDLLP